MKCKVKEAFNNPHVCLRGTLQGSTFKKKKKKKLIITTTFTFLNILPPTNCLLFKNQDAYSPVSQLNAEPT
jgi:hypothetical protein